MAVQWNRRQLLVELSGAENTIRPVAEASLRKQVFDPAVAEMQLDFLSHPITQELKAGPDGTNTSNTLEAPFPVPEGADSKDYTPPNLFAFLGFPEGTDPTEEIEKRLTTNTRGDGPRLKYIGMDKDRLSFRFTVYAPSAEAIEDATPLPWAGGNVSWVKRIEQGVAGIGFFLNAKRSSPEPSRSGSGIQVPSQIRSGRFRPTSYLSGILRSFLDRIAGKGN